MFQLLKSMLGIAAAAPPGKKPAASTRPALSAKPKQSNTLDYRAVSLAPGSNCCMAAKTVAGKQFLWREAPRLPLVDCTNPTECLCKLRKKTDRRDDDERRLDGAGESARWFTGNEQRKRKGRRTAEC